MSANQPTGAKRKSVPKKVDWKALEVVHPDAAGIDVGGSEHWVAVSPDRDPEPVRCFSAQADVWNWPGKDPPGQKVTPRTVSILARVNVLCTCSAIFSS